MTRTSTARAKNAAAKTCTSDMCPVHTPRPDAPKALGYCVETKDHAATSYGELLGYYRSAIEAETALDQHIYAQLSAQSAGEETEAERCPGVQFPCGQPATETIISATGGDWETARTVELRYCAACAEELREPLIIDDAAEAVDECIAELMTARRDWAGDPDRPEGYSDAELAALLAEPVVIDDADDIPFTVAEAEAMPEYAQALAASGRRCPDQTRWEGDVVGCGSTSVERGDDGLMDCLDCGMWFDPAREMHGPFKMERVDADDDSPVYRGYSTHCKLCEGIIPHTVGEHRASIAARTAA